MLARRRAPDTCRKKWRRPKLAWSTFWSMILERTSQGSWWTTMETIFASAYFQVAQASNECKSWGWSKMTSFLFALTSAARIPFKLSSTPLVSQKKKRYFKIVLLTKFSISQSTSRELTSSRSYCAVGLRKSPASCLMKSTSTSLSCASIETVSVSLKSSFPRQKTHKARKVLLIAFKRRFCT